MKRLNILLVLLAFLVFPYVACSQTEGPFWPETIILSCESLEEDAERLRAEFDNRFPRGEDKYFELLSHRQLRFEKAKPPKQIVDEYNLRCVYCWSYHENTKHLWDGRTSSDTNNQIVIVLQSGSIKLLGWTNFIYYEDTKGFAPDEASRKKARERFRKLWDITCPYQQVKEKHPDTGK